MEHVSENNSTTKRVQVSFTKEQWILIQSVKGEFGVTDAEVIRNIVISWLSEKSFVSSSGKNKLGI